MNKVSLIKCETYEPEIMKSALLKSVENLGGLGPYLKPGERVLLKVNLLAKRKPDEAVTTHPAVVKALSEILIDYGCKVLIGDSPGGPFSSKMLNGLYSTTGMSEILSVGAELNFNIKSFEKNYPAGFVIKHLTLSDMLNDVDKVISVSKLKTHGMMTFTGAVKNMFGVVPGVKKAEYHLNLPDCDLFADALLDICRAASPVLSFMDGVIGMEGAGPGSGDPRAVNLILASDSPYHLDKTAIEIIGLKPDDVPTVKRSIHWGLCTRGFGDMSISGGTVSDFKINDFKMPHGGKAGSGRDSKILGAARRFVSLRPMFKRDLCVSCGVCRDNCPAKVIDMDKNNKPRVKLDKCIRCYCCQELCPAKAVIIKGRL